MDLHLVDTNVVSAAAALKHPRHDDVIARLAGLGDAPLYIPAIVPAEIAYGLQVAPDLDAAVGATMREELRKYRVLPVDEHTAEPYGAIRAHLFNRLAARDAKGKIKHRRVEDLRDTTTSRELGIQENDLWIVSLAVQYDAMLVTLDGRMQPIVDAAKASTGWSHWQPWLNS